MTPINNSFFITAEQLSPQAIALYIDAMRLKRVDDLPAQIYEHAQHNPLVLRHIIGLYARLNGQEIAQPHPFFDVYLPEQRLLFKQSRACKRLEYYDEEATFKSTEATDITNKTADEEFVKENKIFSWSPALPKNLLLLVIDNEEEEKFAATIPNGFVLELPQTSFPNALYYYKLIDEEGDIREIGSFYVFRY